METVTLHCPICRELFDDPRILPRCGHTFCLSCIRLLTRRNIENNRTCPECRTPFQLPRHRADNLPRNIIASQLSQSQRIAVSVMLVPIDRPNLHVLNDIFNVVLCSNSVIVRDALDGIFWNPTGTGFCPISDEISIRNHIVYWYAFHYPYF